MTIAGKWNLTLTTPMGPHSVIADFLVDNEQLGGRMDGATMAGNIEGKVNGDRLTWSTKVTRPMTITLSFDVSVNDQKMTGKVKFGMFAHGDVVGARC